MRLNKRRILTGFTAVLGGSVACSHRLFAEPAVPPSGTGIRNVLFIVSDDLKAIGQGCDGIQGC